MYGARNSIIPQYEILTNFLPLLRLMVCCICREIVIWSRYNKMPPSQADATYERNTYSSGTAIKIR